jgi:hypothetical protein
MRVPVEESEKTDDRHCNSCRRLNSERDRGSQDNNRQCDPNFDHREIDARDTKRAANRHDAYESCWHEEYRPAAELEWE